MLEISASISFHGANLALIYLTCQFFVSLSHCCNRAFALEFVYAPKLPINDKFWEFSASEMIVTRSFPVGSLVKEKKIGVQYLQHLEQWLLEYVQLRSSTF